LYARRGFAEAGLRRAYYPAAKGQREDAVVMSLDLRGR
jgi:[ribosomal protein S18]-alanine N-acetyltransferase